MSVMGRVEMAEREDLDVLELELADAIEPPPVAIGGDERRMHVRAYNYWVSLLDGRTYPSVVDIDANVNADFGPHSVLIDVSRGVDDASIAFVGAAIRAECDLPGSVASMSEVPPRSLLSRLTDHHMQIIANRAPVGFEAEFDSASGRHTAYRGILMPFASDGETIDFILGVINWKEIALLPELAELELEVAQALANPPPRNDNPVWDTPLPEEPATLVEPVGLGEPADDEALADWLAHARHAADEVKQADGRSRAALYSALGHAYDFALQSETRAEEYRELLAETGVTVQERAPMTPVVKLVFGADYDKTRLTEFAAALSYGKRNGLPKGGMRLFLERYPGGLKAIVAAERRERRPAERAPKPDATRERARKLPPQTILNLPGEDEFVIIVARRVDPDFVGVIGVAPDDKSLLDRALRHVIA